MKPPLKAALQTLALGLSINVVLIACLSSQLKEEIRQHEAFNAGLVRPPSPAIPAHVENIARKYHAGYTVSDMEMEVLSEFINEHTPEWNAWAGAQAGTQDSITIEQPF